MSLFNRMLVYSKLLIATLIIIFFYSCHSKKNDFSNSTSSLFNNVYLVCSYKDKVCLSDVYMTDGTGFIKNGVFLFNNDSSYEIVFKGVKLDSCGLSQCDVKEYNYVTTKSGLNFIKTPPIVRMNIQYINNDKIWDELYTESLITNAGIKINNDKSIEYSVDFKGGVSIFGDYHGKVKILKK